MVCLSRLYGTAFIRAALLSLGLSLFGAAIAVAAEMRTWTDSTGKFKIQGKFVSNENGKITLEKPDGSEMEIDLKKLSTADQKYVADLEKGDDPFKPKSDDPFKSKPSPGGTKDTTDKGPAVESKLITPDWSDARTVLISAPDQPWKFELPEKPEAPAPAAGTGTGAASSSKAKHKSISVPPKSDFFDGAKGLVGSPSGKFAAIGYVLHKPGQQGGTTRVVVCDLEKGKQIGEGSIPGTYVPLSVHNNGTQVLMKREEWGHGNQDRLELWTVSAKRASKGLQWVPYADETGGNRDIAWGSFIGDDRFASVSGGGKLAVWDLEGIKPLYHLQIQGGSKPAISPDQKYLAFATGKEVAILDLVEGEVVAMQSTPQVNWPVLAFSPNSQRLGMAAFDRLLVWDFANGELYREMPYHGMHVSGDITWPSDDHVLLGKRYLVELENQVKLWDYQGGEFVQQIGGTSWFLVSDGDKKPGALLGAQLPPPAVKDLLAKALTAPDFFVLKPGATVKVEVSGVDAAGKAAVEKGLTAKLKELGFKVGPEGTIDCVAQTEVGQDRQVSYHIFGQPGSQTYTVRDYISRIKFVYKGQEVWQTQVGSVPGFIHLGRDETLDQYLRKSEKFNFDWFGKADLPKLLQKPPTMVSVAPGAPPSPVPTLGKTTLSTSGIR